MTPVFCTMFDAKYADRGIALYRSLKKHVPDFKLYILCLDQAALDLLSKLALPEVIYFPLESLGDKELEAVRPTRKLNEFSWTCKPSLLSYVFSKVDDGTLVSYLDSDMLVFSSFDTVWEEMGASSIMITPHNFTSKQKGKEKEVGTFNAGAIFMRKDAHSAQCLKEWRLQCLTWCYDRKQNGLFADQTYLNEWPSKYSNVHSSAHPGINTGPWNLGNNSVTRKNEEIYLNDKPLVIYHFHPLKVYLDRQGKLQGLPVTMINGLIYSPYIEALNETVSMIRSAIPEYTASTDPFPGTLRILKQKLLQLFR